MSIMSTGLSDDERRGKGHHRSVLGPQWDGRDSFTIEEAGKILGLSRPSAYAAAKRGDLPVLWIGRRGIIPRTRLERLLAGDDE
jgi:excisionase family DNA binding protein